MPLSEMNDIINEYRIPNINEYCQSVYIKTQIDKLVAFLPRGPIPFDTISYWVELFLSYNINQNGKTPESLDSLIQLCINYTPEYDWCKLFENEHFYHVIMSYGNLSPFFFPFDKPLKSTGIRPLLQHYLHIFTLSPTGLINIGMDSLINLFQNDIYTICLYLLKLETYEKHNIYIKYYKLTEKEENAIVDMIWSVVESDLLKSAVIGSSIAMFEFFSNKLLSKLSRCVEEGLNEDNVLQINRTITAINALIIGNQVYINPKPNSEYLSILLSSLNYLFEYTNSVDESRISILLEFFSGLYRQVNLSCIIILYISKY